MAKNRSEFMLLLRLHRKAMTPRERARSKKKKASHAVYPIAIEHSYAEEISGTMKHVISFILTRLEKRLSTWIAIHDSTVRVDSPDQELEQILKEAEEEITRIFATGAGVSTVAHYVESVAQRLFGFADTRWRAQLEAVLGIPFNTGFTWWADVENLWFNENMRLIKSLSQEYITKLNTLLRTGFQSGWSFQEMVEAIQTLSDKMSGFRARLIARDQVGKLNYAITRTQFESIGMDGYLWITARDERVRGNPTGRYPKAIPSHWIMDSMVGKWADPTIYSVDGVKWLKRHNMMPFAHPGQEIACRCMATPFWIPLMEEVDALIEEAA